MSKYTPGPLVWSHGEVTQVLRADGHPIATVHSSAFDAALFAASPKLLDALKEALIHIRCAVAYAPNKTIHDVNRATGEVLKIRGHGDVLRTVAESIERVIAEAEGKE